MKYDISFRAHNQKFSRTEAKYSNTNWLPATAGKCLVRLLPVALELLAHRLTGEGYVVIVVFILCAWLCSPSSESRRLRPPPFAGATDDPAGKGKGGS